MRNNPSSNISRFDVQDGSNSQYENHVEGRGMQNGMAMLSYAARCMKN
jgi:hypothetical protein